MFRTAVLGLLLAAPCASQFIQWRTAEVWPDASGVVFVNGQPKLVLLYAYRPRIGGSDSGVTSTTRAAAYRSSRSRSSRRGLSTVGHAPSARTSSSASATSGMHLGATTGPWCQFSANALLDPLTLSGDLVWFAYCNDQVWSCPALCAGQPGSPDRWDAPQWMLLVVSVGLR